MDKNRELDGDQNEAQVFLLVDAFVMGFLNWKG